MLTAAEAQGLTYESQNTTAAIAAVLNTYELVEIILSELDRASIHRCEKVCRRFRSVVRDSLLIGRELAGVSPIRRSDIKTLTKLEHAQMISIIEANGTSGNGFGIYVERNFKTLLQGISFCSRHNFFYYQLVMGSEFDATPHYSRPSKFEINPRLKPKSLRANNPGDPLPPPPYVCDVRGTTVELHLGDFWEIEQCSRALLGSPEHYATNPPITVVRMTLYVHRMDYLACMVRNSTGIRLWDLVDTYRRMVRTLRNYGGRCCTAGHAYCCLDCVAAFVHDTLPQRLRDIDVELFA